MSILTNPEVTLERIDLLLDDLDHLIHDLPIPNKSEHCQKVFDLYAALESAVNKL